MHNPSYKLKTHKEVDAVFNYLSKKYDFLKSKSNEETFLVFVGDYITYRYYFSTGRWLKCTEKDGKAIAEPVTGSTLSGMRSCITSDCVMLESMGIMEPKEKVTDKSSISSKIVSVLSVVFKS